MTNTDLVDLIERHDVLIERLEADGAWDREHPEFVKLFLAYFGRTASQIELHKRRR